MHHIHHTSAFVLSSFPFGEAGKILNLLTKDYGVIRVIAQGTRKTESKLRQSIQDFSLTKIAMVCGKGGWRLTNAAIEKNYFNQLEREAIKVVSRVFSLVERMIPDEESNSVIFSIALEMCEFLENSKKPDLKSVEIATVLKIMHELGYVADEKKLYSELMKELPEFTKFVQKKEKEMIILINQAINESHL